MDDHHIPKTRKGKNGLKKDQHIKSQNDSIFGSKKHVRLKEKIMEHYIGTKHNIKSSIDYIRSLSTNLLFWRPPRLP